MSARFAAYRAFCEAVSCAECTLPAPARLVVLSIAFMVHEGETFAVEALGRYAAMSPRTVQRYLRLLQERCGEDPIAFAEDVITGKRAVDEWTKALVTHGGRVG